MSFISVNAFVSTFTLVFCLSVVGCGESSSGPDKLKISVDTSSNHLRNIVLKEFVEKLQQNASVTVVPELYESAQLTKDRDVAKALHWGSIEMAVPAQSKLTRFVPEANLFTLPILYGLPPDVIFSILDGELGDEINHAIEQRLGVKILGDYIILGFTSTYTTTNEIKNVSDLKDLKIRVPGGAGPISLYSGLGVNPLALPISDLALALSQGNLNGIQSTHETVASAKLWDVGLKYCFEDRANLIVYVPMISLHFWNSIEQKEQDILSSTWAGVVKDARTFANDRQVEAKARLAAKGIECVQPQQDELEIERLKMKDISAELVNTLGISAPLYDKLLMKLETLNHVNQGGNNVGH